MATDKQNTAQPAGPGDTKETVRPHAQSVGDLCRCKETAVMKPRELLQVMINDLSFWKKKKKGK